MRKVWVVALACGFASSVTAQPAGVPPGSANIVTISFNTAVLQTAEAQRELASLQAKYAPRQAHLEALNTEIEGLRKQVGNDPAKVSSLDGKEKQLQREAEDFRAETQAASEQTFQQVAQKLYAFLQEFSAQHEYSAVIERGSDSAPVVWYAAANLDITKAVVDGYNAKATTSVSPAFDAPSSKRGTIPAKPKVVTPNPR